MKIVLFDYIFEQSKPGITGLSDLVWNWAKHLIALGDEVHIVAPYSKDAQPPQGAIIHRFRVPPIGYRNVVGHILIVLRGWLEIRKLKDVDLIHAPEYISTSLLSLLMPNIPVVLTTPGNIYERIAHGNPFDWYMTQVLKMAAYISARRCAHISAMSHEMRYWWIQSGTPENRITVIPTGVDLDLFRPSSSNQSQLDLPKRRPSVLYIARLSDENGLPQLLEAISLLIRNGMELDLIVLGDGPRKNQYQSRVAELDIERFVHWEGWVDLEQLPEYYISADVFVAPHLSGGLPRVVLYAMACGVLCVGSRISGISDHISDGETGFLVDPGNIDQLTERIKQVLDCTELAREIGYKASIYAQQTVNWSAVIERTREEIYKPLLLQR